MVYINSFEGTLEKDSEYVGEKGVSVAEIYKNYNTPKGFIVSTGAFSSFVERSGIKQKISQTLSMIGKSKSIQDAGNEIQKIIVETPMPDFISKEISDAYQNLKRDFNSKEDLPVAVRSSYIKEVSHKDISQLTFLNVSGKDNIMMAIKVAWASLFTYKNMAAREELKIGHDVKNAVIIQGMVYPEKSVIAYSFNPSNSDGSKVYIKAMFGIGEGFMYPETPFDVYITEKENASIKDKIIARQPFSYSLNIKNKKIAKFMLGKKENEQKLTDSEITELSKFVESISKSKNSQVRVEIGIIGEKVFIFQIKKVSVELKKPEELKEEETKPETQTNAEVNEIPPSVEVIQKEFIDDLKQGIVPLEPYTDSHEDNADSNKTLLELAEEEINGEEKAYDKDLEDAYIELKDIKSDFEPAKEEKSEEKEEDEEKKPEEEPSDDDSIFSNMNV